MLLRSFPAILLLAVMLAIASGCGGGPSLPDTRPQSELTVSSTIPDMPDSQTGQQTTVSKSVHHLWGYHDIIYDPDTRETEVIPRRDVAGHWNVLSFLEQGPCHNCVRVVSSHDVEPGVISFEVEITHPFSNPNLTGFDVRGIAMFDGSREFPAAGVTVPDARLGDGELVNAEAYTSLYNSSTVGSGPGGFQGYIDGRFAPEPPPDATLNGFVAYFSADPDAVGRAIFYAGDSVRRDFDIDFPDGSFVFGYAVDACWVPPTTTPVTDPEADFPPEANCPEPSGITTSLQGSGLTILGGEIVIWATVYDFGAMATHGVPTVECPELWDGALEMTNTESRPNFSKWRIELTNENLAPEGTYLCLVSVEDNENGSAPPWLDLSTYQIQELEVLEETGWARTWGGPYSDTCKDVSVDTHQNCVIATGYFDGEVDFDPGPEEEIHTSNGGYDGFVTKFNQFGDLEWAITFGGEGDDMGMGLGNYSGSCILVSGFFSGTVDFDPSDETAIRTSNGGRDAFVLRLGSIGALNWVATWGGPEDDFATDAGVVQWGLDCHAIGYYRGTVDFDPGPGTFNRTSNGGSDCFMSIFESDGTWIETLTWGGSGWDRTYATHVTAPGRSFIVGSFSGSVDFDPGPGEDMEYSVALLDAFLMALDTNCEFDYVRSWGGYWDDEAFGVACDEDGVCYVTGYFNEAVDFDPTVDVDSYESNGGEDVFLVKYSDLGSYQWTRTWGGSGYDRAESASVDTLGGVYVSGSFEGTVDFDPTTGTDERASNGGFDSFLTRLFTDGSYSWTRTLGCWIDDDTAFGVAALNDLYVFSAGAFNDEVDFRPGAGADMHTSNGACDAYLIKYFPDGSW